jgi:toxoflavin biosynthesis protein ToxD
MAGARVFISHDSRDDAFCRTLASLLRAVGADVWYDESDLDWAALRDQIDRELPTRPAFIVVLSPEALASARVRLAVDSALELMRTREVRAFVSVVARRCSVPQALSALPCLDATAGLDSVRDALLDALGLSLPASSEVALAPAAPRTPTAPERGAPTTLPPRLEQLGYKGWRVGGVEFIAPPLSLVPAGPFMMGGREDPNEMPIHKVTLPLYAIGTFPVLVAEYACYARSEHAPPADVGRTTWSIQFSRLDHPVVNVSWHNAMAYAEWLSRMTGERWRLPTEAEWEKAARWDPATWQAREYPWGDTFESARCNTRMSSIGSTTPVGMYPNGASPYGVQDMAGNVREWTSSLFAAYPYDAHDGRERADVIGDRVQRGDSWFGYSSDARAAFRDWHAPDEVSSVVGFRLALDAPDNAARPSPDRPMLPS